MTHERMNIVTAELLGLKRVSRSDGWYWETADGKMLLAHETQYASSLDLIYEHLMKKVVEDRITALVARHLHRQRHFPVYITTEEGIEITLKCLTAPLLLEAILRAYNKWEE